MAIKIQNMQEAMHIALAFDEAYIHHGSATIASVLFNADPGDVIEFHVIDNGLSQSSRMQLQTYVAANGGKIQFIKLDLRQFASLPKTIHTDAMYSRLALPDLLPQLERVLYLDSDVIVLKSLRPLWQQATSEMLCCAVQDAADVFKGSFLDHKVQIGLNTKDVYLNSGVLLMNLAKWRIEGIALKIISFLENVKVPFVFPDQDALNVILNNRATFIDPVWNVPAPLIRAVRYGIIQNPEWIAAVRDPAIIHYTTSEKPWNQSCAVPRRADYRRFANLVTGKRSWAKPPKGKEIFHRLWAEGMEFRYWLAAFIKGRLRRI